MDVIRDVTGEEAKLLALQFLGQNLGEMKELDKHIVSSLKPIAGTINPNVMLQSIPQGQNEPQVQQTVPPSVAPSVVTPPQVQVQLHQPTAGPIIIPSISTLQSVAVAPAQQPVPASDPNQLELNFNASPYSEQIFNKLDALDRKFNTLIKTQQQIIESIEDIKKKSEAVQATA